MNNKLNNNKGMRDVEIKKNFEITYDKNLKPADMKEKLKEVPIKKRNNENSNKNDQNENNLQNEMDNNAELLSSYSPSVKTKSKFFFF